MNNPWLKLEDFPSWFNLKPPITHQKKQTYHHKERSVSTNQYSLYTHLNVSV